MSDWSIRKPKELLESIVNFVQWRKPRIDKAFLEYPKFGKIGDYTITTDEKNAKLLNDLKSSDLENIRWPR